MVNCDEHGVRYGIISANSLHPDVVHDLCYGSQAKDLSYEAAREDATNEAEKAAEAVEEDVKIAVAERDYALLSNDNFMEKEVDAAYERLGFDGREDFIEHHVEREMEHLQIEEPIYAGTLDDVRYRATWIGGALNFWVFYSPYKSRFQQCSPVVPNAANLDHPDEDGAMGYDVPTEWRWNDESN